MSTYGQLSAQITELFAKNNLESPSFQAKQLLLHHFDLNTTQLFLQKNQPVSSESKLADLHRDAEKIAAGEPLQYIIGQWEFMGRPFLVGPGVLIPRPETEMLCQLALAFLDSRDQTGVLFDLCAGTGCVGLTIAASCPQVQVYLFEKSPAALHYCRQNAALHSLQNVQVIPHDIFEEYDLGCMADVILSNPPYIETAALPGLQLQVQKEPAMALDGGPDGLDFYRTIANGWLCHLRQGGFLAVEHGEGQSGDVMALLSPGVESLQMHRDLAGHDRVVSGKRK